MLSAIVENSGRSRVGVIRPGPPPRPVTRILINIPRQLIKRHFPTRVRAAGWRRRARDGCSVWRGRRRQRGPH